MLSSYRYRFQGQEKDPETGKEAFQLRLWDGRIGRWLTTDPAGQYSSPYLGMGNNPVTRVDPDGGFDWVSKDGIHFYWDSTVNSESEATAKNLFYGGKTPDDAAKVIKSNLSWVQRIKWAFGSIGKSNFIDYNSKNEAYAPGLVDEIIGAKRANSLKSAKKIKRDWLASQDLDDYELKLWEVIGEKGLFPGTVNHEVAIGKITLPFKIIIRAGAYESADRTFNKVTYGLYANKPSLGDSPITDGSVLLGRIGSRSDILILQFESMDALHLMKTYLNGR